MSGNDYFIFNGVKSTDRNVLLRSYSRTFIASSEAIVEKIYGSIGSAASDTGGRSDVTITCRVANIKSDQRDVIDTFHGDWLSGVEKKLYLWDIPGKHFIATVIDPGETTDFDVWTESEIQFLAKPYIVSDDPITVIPTTPFVNNGTDHGYGIITLKTTEATNVLTVKSGTRTITIQRSTGTFPAGTTFTINLEEEYVKQGSSSAMQYVTFDSKFFSLHPGENQFVCTNCTASLVYIERWRI